MIRIANDNTWKCLEQRLGEIQGKVSIVGAVYRLKSEQEMSNKALNEVKDDHLDNVIVWQRLLDGDGQVVQ